MNIIVSNEQKNSLLSLDIEVIKNISGLYEVQDIIDMLKTFFFNKIIIDVTALKNYNELGVYEQLINGFETDKIILLLPEKSMLCTPNFLANIISLGIYNFTTNVESIKYLIENPNHLEDVEHIFKLVKKNTNNNVNNQNNNTNQNMNTNLNTNNIQNMSSNLNMNRNGNLNTIVNDEPVQKNIFTSVGIGKDVNDKENSDINNKYSNNNNIINDESVTVIGFKNLTEHAGATTFIYMLKKELSSIYGKNSTVAVEIDRNDFEILKDPNMVYSKGNDILKIIEKYPYAKFVLVDLNNSTNYDYCTDVIYLLEPSTLKLNKLILNNRYALTKVASKKIVLNQSLLLNKDVYDFEKEVGINVFYNMPPLDDRKRNAILSDFLAKLGILVDNGLNDKSSNKIFGLFRR